MKRLFSIFVMLVIVSLSIPSLAQKRYSFRGHLGKNISFRLDLEMNQDSIIAGETTYFRKKGKIARIPVYGKMLGPDKQGYWNGNALFLHEYNSDKLCGSFVIALSDDDKFVEGSWNWDSKEYDINSVEETDFPADTTYFHPARTAAEINGKYSFADTSISEAQANNNHMGSCLLSCTGKKVHYCICVINPNIAEHESTSTLQGSYFTGRKKAYRFKAYIDRNFVYIWTTQNGEVEDWGAWTTLEGVYIKSKK